MAMTLYETTFVTNDMICFEFREPDIVKGTIRDATAAELQVGGVFEPLTLVSVSNANPAVFTFNKTIPWADGDYIRISKALGRNDLNQSGVVSSKSGSTCQISFHSGNSLQLYNGAHGGTYTGNSAIACKLASGTGSLRKHIMSRNLNKVKDADYFPGPRGDRTTTTGARYLAGYTIAGKTLTWLGIEITPYNVGYAGYGATPDDVRYVCAFSFFVYLKASSAFANGTYAVTVPSGLGIAPFNITLNDKTTRNRGIGVNQIGYKSTDESKIATLCQYAPQAANYGSIRYLTDYSITDYHLLDEADNIVWSAGAAPVLRLANTSAETGGALDSLSADPDTYGVAITAVTPGNPTRITAPGHGLVTNDTCSVLYTRGVHAFGADLLYYRGNVTATRIDNNVIDVNIDTTTATSWISGGKVTKNVSLNYAGVHTYEMDFSSFTGADGTYRLYIPGFGVSDPVYIKDSAWAEIAKIGMKGLYHQASGLALDGRFGRTAIASAKVGVDGQTEILKTDLPHFLFVEQASGRIPLAIPQRFITGTAPSDLWGGFEDAGDHDRVINFFHASELAHMLGALALVPLASRYTNYGWVNSKDTIGGTNYPSKFFCDPIDAAIWYLDMLRRTQEVGGGIISYIGMDVGLSDFPQRLGVSPSCHANYSWVAMGADHVASIQYAYAAALLAWHLKQMGHTALGNTFQASAVLAYTFYETVVAGTHPADYYTAAKALYTVQPVAMSSANPLTFTQHPVDTYPLVNSDGVQVVASGFTGGFAVMNGVTYCLRQSGFNILVYDSTNTTPVNASGYGAYTGDTGVFTFTTAAWRTIWDVVATAQGLTTTGTDKYKAAAAGILYTLTGTAAYKTYHDANYNLAGELAWGTYIYSLAGGADASVVSTFYSACATNCTSIMLTTGGINDRSFTYFYNNGAMQEYGRTVQPTQQFAAMAMIAHKKAYADRIALLDTHAQAKANSGVKKYAKVLQDAYAFLLGVNPPKICLATGHGARSPAKILNINADAEGSAPPAGIYPYWLSTPGRYTINPNAYSYIGAPLFDSGATTSGGTPDDSAELIPHRYVRPRMMSFLPIPWFVEPTEYNVSKLYYLIGIALYLQHWEGSCVQADGKKRLIARAA